MVARSLLPGLILQCSHEEARRIAPNAAKERRAARFWGVERTDDPNLAGDILQESGLWLDRRREFPRKVAELSIATERPVAASLLAPVRRVLADSVSQERERAVSAAAGD